MTKPIPKTASASGYSILIPQETLARTSDFLQALRDGHARAGEKLSQRLRGLNLRTMTELELLGKLFETKQPRIYAESEVSGDGSDWSLTELGLLGDISIAVPVTIFDDGKHCEPALHNPPLSGTLVFTPGALLDKGKGQTAADWNEVAECSGQLSAEGYYNLYRRRLLPVFRYINDRTGKPRSALVTVPGLGCGAFAGTFRGQLGTQLQTVLERFLAEYGESFPNINGVYFDPFNECECFRKEIHGISFMVRPLKAMGKRAKSQLCPPADYAEPGDNFLGCALFSIVAWDHVSWPGNDFFIGSRATDDGVKAAATNSMAVLTGVKGEYDPSCFKYLPPPPYAHWADVVVDRKRGGNLRLWNPRAVWRATDER